MKKHEYNLDTDMLLSSAQNWRTEIWLPRDAQISEIHMRVYSFPFPDFIYGIKWGNVIPDGDRLLIPIDASRPGRASKEEAVRLAIDITYYSDLK